MSHVFHQLYYHFVWSTQSREPLIDRTWRPQLLEIINEEVKTRAEVCQSDTTRCRTTHIFSVGYPQRSQLLISLDRLKARRRSELTKRYNQSSNCIGRKVTVFLPFGRMRSRKCRVTSTDRKITTSVVVCQLYSRPLKQRMIFG
jgi:hypothetical protein